MRILKRFNQQRKTAIIVTHDMDLVAEHAHRCIVLREGEVTLIQIPETRSVTLSSACEPFVLCLRDSSETIESGTVAE